MARLLLIIVLFFLEPSFSQNVLHLTRSIQERSELLQSSARLNPSLFPSRSRSNDLFSIDDVIDLIDASVDESLSAECGEDLRELISAHEGTFNYPEFEEQVWLPIRDSSGRIHQAILKGHTSFAGHFSECVHINAKLSGRERPFTADYFKLDIDARFRSSSKNDSCVVSDEGAFLGWSIGICLPASCSSSELEQIIIGENAPRNPICGIQKTSESIDSPNAGYYVTISIMGAVFAICLVSGFADYFFSEHINGKRASKGLAWQLFMSFSLYTNVASIFDTSGPKKDGQITPIQCMRFFSMCWVVLGHLSGLILNVVANPVDMLDLTADLTTEFILNAFFSVDTFFFIGSLLLTFLWFKSYQRNPNLTNSPLGWVMLYVHRILRLSPPFFMIVMFYAFVLPQFYRNTPFSMNPASASDCKETWWLEFTYLFNFMSYEKQCLGYSWYLATDTQMFFFTPLLIIPLAIKPIIGFIVAAVIFAISTSANIFLVYHYHWPATVQFVGPTDPAMTNYDDYMMYMYMSPLTRCPVYIIGMLVGWFLQRKPRMRINPIVNIVLWIISIAVMLTLILGLHVQTSGDVLPIFWRAMFSAFSKPAWALALSWIIFSCYYGYGGPINAFMSWHIWVPLGRLSFCGYLVHYPIIYILFAQSHDEVYFSSFTDFTITRLLPTIVLTYLVSIFWSACFEISFGKMEMLLLGGRQSQRKEKLEEPILVERKSSKCEA